MVDGRMPGSERGRSVCFEIDGQTVTAYVGETVATALNASGRLALRRSARRDAPRGVFCNMGICYECLVYFDGYRDDSPGGSPRGPTDGDADGNADGDADGNADGNAAGRAVRACTTLVEEGMRLRTWRPEEDSA